MIKLWRNEKFVNGINGIDEVKTERAIWKRERNEQSKPWIDWSDLLKWNENKEGQSMEFGLWVEWGPKQLRLRGKWKAANPINLSPAAREDWWMGAALSFVSFLFFRNNEEWIVVGYGLRPSAAKKFHSIQFFQIEFHFILLAHSALSLKKRRALRQRKRIVDCIN